MINIHPGASGVEMVLAPELAEVLGQVPDLLASVGRASKDPAADRLTPHAYVDDDEAAEEFDRLMLPELEAGRAIDRDLYAALLSDAADGTVEMTGDEALAVLRVLDEARLVMAARLGIDSDEWQPDAAAERSPEFNLYHLLGWVQDALIEASEPILLGNA